MATEPAFQSPGGRLVFAACCWVGLLAGIAELLVLWIQQLQQPMLRISADFAWSVPITLLVVIAAATVPPLLLSHWRERVGVAAALFAAASLAFLDLLLLVPRLAPYAAALLAAGLAVQATRFVLKDAARTRRVIRSSFPAVGGLLIATWGGIWITSRPASATSVRPGSGTNVLFITLDTVRATSLSLYSYRRETTPNLVRYAARGVVFDRAFATAPWTLPSHGSLFTGRWPHELSTDYETPLDDRHPTLAEHFSGLGYATAGFVANLGYCSRGTGLARGFAHYEDYPRSLGQVVSNSTLLRTVADNFTIRRLIENDEHLNRITARDINDRFLGWLRTKPDAPFFAFLNYFDAHEPYLPPAPFDRTFGAGRQNGRHSPLHHAQWNPAAPSKELPADELQEEIDAYDGALAYLDQQLGALLDDLAVRGILDRTLVVITSDHGEEFAEHRVLEHGYSMYRPALHVPLLLILPNSVPAGRRVRTPVSLVDIAATVIDLAGGASSQTLGGNSLSRLWKGVEPGEATTLSELTRPPGDQPEWYPIRKGDMKALVYRGFRYIRNGDNTEELYSLEFDPWEARNLAAAPGYASILIEARSTLNSVVRRR